MTRRLVLTADDLGHDAPTNREIVALLRERRITTATLIVVAPAAADAVRLVREARESASSERARVPVPRLHVTLTSTSGMAPWRPMADDVPSLTDEDGAFHVNPFLLGERARPEEIERELRAQLDWMRGAGLEPTGLDSHSGVLYGLHGGGFLDVALRFCAEHGLAFRLPRSLDLYGVLSLPAEMRAEAEEYHAGAVAAADALGVRLPQEVGTGWRPASELGRYEALREHYLGMLPRLPEGTSEIFLHPAPAEAVEQVHNPEEMTRAWELRLLRDPVFAAAIEAEGIELSGTW